MHSLVPPGADRLLRSDRPDHSANRARVPVAAAVSAPFCALSLCGPPSH